MPTKRQTKPKPAARKLQRKAMDIVNDIDAARAKIRDAHAELHVVLHPEDIPIPAPTPHAPPPDPSKTQGSEWSGKDQAQTTIANFAARDESHVGQICRRFLRAKQGDGPPLSAAEDAKIRLVADAISKSYDKAKEKDPNVHTFTIEWPPEIQNPQFAYEQQKKADDECHEREHRENMAEIASRLHEITYSVPSRRLLGFMNILRDENGCATPFEEFIVELVSDYAYGRGVTPDDVEKQLKDFRESFDMTLETARLFTTHYPESLKPTAAAA